MGDLGAESIDFLDIVFRLEKAFDIKIPRGELFPEDVLTDPKYVQDGRVTEVGLAELRKRMPFANLDEFAKNPVVQDFGNLLTVADMCRFVESKVQVTDEARRSPMIGPLPSAGVHRCVGTGSIVHRVRERRRQGHQERLLGRGLPPRPFPRYPVLPNSLVIEGLAQTGGLLVCEHNQFTEKVILAKIPKVQFFCEALPGDTLTYTATIEYIKEEGAAVTPPATRASAAGRGGNRLRPPERPLAGRLFSPEAFLSMMRVLRGLSGGPRRRRRPAAAARPALPRPTTIAATTPRRRPEGCQP